MGLKGFMDKAYRGKARSRHLETHKGDVVFGLEDLSERLGPRPSKDQVAELVDDRILPKLLSTDPGKKYMELWGCLTSVASERSLVPLRLPGRDFAGFQMSSGVLVLEVGGNGGNHLGERMSGGRIFIKGPAGSHLGQDMSEGGIVADSCGNYAFKGMKGGWGVIMGRQRQLYGPWELRREDRRPGKLRREGRMAHAPGKSEDKRQCWRLPGSPHERRRDQGHGNGWCQGRMEDERRNHFYPGRIRS